MWWMWCVENMEDIREEGAAVKWIQDARMPKGVRSAGSAGRDGHMAGY